MAAPKGTRPPEGSRKGIPNKITADVRAMILAALDRVGGQDYLAEQATANPKAFMSLHRQSIIYRKAFRTALPTKTVAFSPFWADFAFSSPLSHRLCRSSFSTRVRRPLAARAAPITRTPI